MNEAHLLYEILFTWRDVVHMDSITSTCCIYLFHDITMQSVKVLQRCFVSRPGSRYIAVCWVKLHPPYTPVIQCSHIYLQQDVVFH